MTDRKDETIDPVPGGAQGSPGSGLLPCPFCGGEAVYRADHTTERVDTVSCPRCDFYLSDDGYARCTDLWNRRASPDQVPVPAGYRVVGYAREVDVDPSERPLQGRKSFWTSEDQNAHYDTPVYVASSALVPVPADYVLMMEDAPWTSRLAHIERRTATERQCGELITSIESLGAHPLLTDALLAADLAMRVLGRWHDEGEPGRSTLASSPETASDRAERRVSKQPEILTDLISLSFDDEDGWAYAIRAPGRNFVPGSHNMNADPHAAIAEMANALRVVGLGTPPPVDIEQVQPSGERADKPKTIGVIAHIDHSKHALTAAIAALFPPQADDK